MGETDRWHMLAMQALFLGLCLAIIYFRLMPMQTLPPSPLEGEALLFRAISPDLMMSLTFAWVLRRPSFAPALLIALVFFLADLLFMRPPGLFALLMVVASEMMKKRAPALAEQGFVPEWLAVAGAMVAVTLLNRVILAVLFLDYEPLGPTLVQLVTTILFYPLVVVVSHVVLGVRRRTPKEKGMMRGMA